MIVSTTIINRIFDDECREVCDREAGVVITAFPAERADAMLKNGRLTTAGPYIILGNGKGHVGESRRLARRLRQQLQNPTKSFGRMYYAVTALGPAFSKQDAVHLQSCLDAAIEDAGIVELVKDQEPWPADLDEWRIAELDRLFPRIVRLLKDAGCYALGVGQRDRGDDLVEEVGEGDMEIPASLGPSTARKEYVLEYSDLQARGCLRADGMFVVMAGSEIRREENQSIIKRIRTRRRRLLAGDLTSKIVGANDRERLDVAVGFPSKAIAAKCLSGAHLRTDNWRSA